MADNQQSISQPTEMANVTPMGTTSNQTRQIVDAVKDAIAPIEKTVSGIAQGRIDDLWRFIYLFGGGFVLLAGMFITGYIRLSDRIETLEKSSVRVEQKLDDLIARIPPVQTTPRR